MYFQWISEKPILDNVIDYSGNVRQTRNEKFLHNEFGVNYRFGKLGLSAYMTDWQIET